tara:strand:+ start:368 stop:616 length:249 start_codon:yes stop_codon:yes gene_type:complete
MPEYDNTNKGALFPNSYKEDGDNKPDFLGNVNVEGEEWRLAAWSNTSKNGKDYLSINVSEPKEKGENAPNGKVTADSDDVPF